MLRRWLIRYLLAVSALVHLGAFALAGLLVYAVWSYHLPVTELTWRAIDKIAAREPALGRAASSFLVKTGFPLPGEDRLPARLFPSPGDVTGRGASPTRLPAAPRYEDGRPLPRALDDLSSDAVVPASRASDREVSVGTSAELLKAIGSAKAGQRIHLLPGTYRLAAKRFDAKGAGTPDAPIVVTASALGEATIELDSQEGFFVNVPYWVFENLRLVGVCGDDSYCEHAFHIVGDGHSTIIRNNEIVDFNSAIKANGGFGSQPPRFPDNVLVEFNSIYNTRARMTSNPVTPIDVVGANGWVVRGNLIADFAKARGDRISYGGFFKGNSSEGLFEQNLVICQMRLQARGIQIGLSLGGGGSGNSPFCRDGSCAREHTRGTIRNNVIVNCPRDAGIYLNRASETQIFHNLLLQTNGIDVRFPESSAVVANNLLDGSVYTRDEGMIVTYGNVSRSLDGLVDWLGRGPGAALPDDLAEALRDRGTVLTDPSEDYCGRARTDGRPDTGPFELAPQPACHPLQ